MTNSHSGPSFEEIQAAAQRIERQVHRTPVFSSRTLNELYGAEFFFKAENLQRSGAFKMRGASNAVACLGENASLGVATHSSGNHGGALALAARQRGIPCWVVMPEGATPSKVEAVKGYGATVVFCTPTQKGREQVAARLVEETGATLVHPYETLEVMAGQGTVALELLQQVENLDFIVPPLGGGGLASGTVIVAAELSPQTQVVAAEPAGADDAKRSLLAGRITPLDRIDTIADGLRATLGERAFSVLMAHQIRVETATEEQIRSSMRLLWNRLKLVVEPSAAVPFAAIVNGETEIQGRRVGIILSGGNTDFPN